MMSSYDNRMGKAEDNYQSELMRKQYTALSMHENLEDRLDRYSKQQEKSFKDKITKFHFKDEK